jgi:hypothetical protein
MGNSTKGETFGATMNTLTDDYRLMPEGVGWEFFHEDAIKLATGQRTDQSRIAIETIMEAADGYDICALRMPRLPIGWAASRIL